MTWMRRKKLDEALPWCAGSRSPGVEGARDVGDGPIDVTR